MLGFTPIRTQPTSHHQATSNQMRVIPGKVVDQSLDFSHGAYKKKVLPEASFSFQSGDFDMNAVDGVRKSYDSRGGPPPRPARGGPSGDWMQARPLPSLPTIDQATPKRRVNAEARVATNQILVHLEHLDEELSALEQEGRQLEEKIRQGKYDVCIRLDTLVWTL